MSSCQKEKSTDLILPDQFVESRINCSLPSTDACTKVPISTTITYEGCILNANANFYICNNEVVMVLGNPVWTYQNGNTPECKTLRQKMHDNFNTPYIGDQLALDLYNAIHKKVIDELQLAFLYWAGNHNGQSVWVCFSTPENPCEGINGNSQISLTVSDCITLCEVGKDEEGLVLLGTVKCGEGCCKRTNRFCFDQLTGQLCKGPSILTQLGSCEPVVSECTNLPKKCSAPCDRL